MRDNPQPATVSAKEFASLLNIHLSTLYRLVEKGKVPEPLPRPESQPGVGKRGGRYLWRSSDVQRFLKGENVQNSGDYHMLKEAMREVLREENLIQSKPAGLGPR